MDLRVLHSSSHSLLLRSNYHHQSVTAVLKTRRPNIYCRDARFCRQQEQMCGQQQSTSYTPNSTAARKNWRRQPIKSFILQTELSGWRRSRRRRTTTTVRRRYSARQTGSRFLDSTETTGLSYVKVFHIDLESRRKRLKGLGVNVEYRWCRACSNYICLCVLLVVGSVHIRREPARPIDSY